MSINEGISVPCSGSISPFYSLPDNPGKWLSLENAKFEDCVQINMAKKKYRTLTNEQSARTSVFTWSFRLMYSQPLEWVDPVGKDIHGTPLRTAH